jgi:DNA repair exonuclease SbcCD ATPase subunit
MKSSEEIQAEIEETQRKLSTLERTLRAKENELAKLRDSHAQMVERTIGRGRMPRSLGKQRESLLALTMEMEGLESAKVNLQGKLTQLQLDLARAHLYETAVADYTEAERRFVEMAEALFLEIRELNQSVANCKTTIDEFLSQPANPVEIISSVINDPALSGLSLEKFFEGEIVQAEPGENDSLVQAIAQKYRKTLLSLPALDSIEYLWVTLSDRLEFVSRAASGLVPRHVKFVPSKPEQSKRPPKLHSRSININPKNLAPTGIPG